jgi:hypothetical protein
MASAFLKWLTPHSETNISNKLISIIYEGVSNVSGLSR